MVQDLTNSKSVQLSIHLLFRYIRLVNKYFELLVIRDAFVYTGSFKLFSSSNTMKQFIILEKNIFSEFNQDLC